MISTYEAFQLFRKMKFNQSLADIIFMIDFIFPGEPFILAKDGSVFAVFEICGIEYESMEPSAIDDIEKEIRVLFELVKEDITFTNYFIRRRGGSLYLACVENAPSLVHFLQNKKQDFYNSLDKANFLKKVGQKLLINGSGSVPVVCAAKRQRKSQAGAQHLNKSFWDCKTLFQKGFFL